MQEPTIKAILAFEDSICAAVSAGDLCSLIFDDLTENIAWQEKDGTLALTRTEFRALSHALDNFLERVRSVEAEFDRQCKRHGPAARASAHPLTLAAE